MPVAGLVAPVLASGRPVAVVMPTVAEAHTLAEVVSEALGIVAWMGTSAEPAAAVTRAWAAPVCAEGQLVVGTREIALWHLGGPGLVVVVEEGRAAMKSPQTPTVGVREVVRRRSAAERFATVLAGPVPTVEALASGVEVHQPNTRTWPLVEVVDRAEEPPGSGVLLEATVRAVAAVVRGGGTVFVFVTRRTEAAAFRCVACGTLRTCPACGAAATGSLACRRCGADLGSCGDCGRSRFQALGAGAGRVVTELQRRVRAVVAMVGEETGSGRAAQVLVGTEADLPAVGMVDLAVVVDADGLVLAPHYRAEEDALRTLARVATTVGRGRGRRCLVQTAQPGHRVFEALRTRPPAPAPGGVARGAQGGRLPAGRRADGGGDRRRPEGRRHRAACRRRRRRRCPGPAPAGARARWLVSGGDLRPLKLALRPVVQSWRDRGIRVRIDVDPVRL